MRSDNIIMIIDYRLTQTVFIANIIVVSILLVTVVWSVVRPDRRIWPPPGRRSWQYLLTWIGWCVAIAINACLLFLDWNSGTFGGGLRFVLGIPLALLGGLLAFWGIATIGWTNSTGVKDGFFPSGPYRFTRNPQYVGDAVRASRSPRRLLSQTGSYRCTLTSLSRARMRATSYQACILSSRSMLT